MSPFAVGSRIERPGRGSLVKSVQTEELGVNLGLTRGLGTKWRLPLQARNLKTNLPTVIGGLTIVYDQVSYQSDAS